MTLGIAAAAHGGERGEGRAENPTLKWRLNSTVLRLEPKPESQKENNQVS
jgi:hypothetical protein